MTTQKTRKSAISLSKLVTGNPKQQYKAADQVVDLLRRGILSGELERGARLPNERQLAEQFGVSQPTIREAVRVLEYMSLVEVRHGSGTYVTGDSQGFISKSLQSLLEIEKKNVDMREIFELKRVLSLYSIELAVDKATEKNLSDIVYFENKLSQAFKEGDYRETVEAALSFQSALSAVAHNPLLFALESFLIELILGCQLVEWMELPNQFMEIWPTWNEMLYQDRHRLLDALQNRNKKQCVTAMEAYHLDQYKIFSAYKPLSESNVTDPNLLYALSNAGLKVPSYRDFHELGNL